MPAGEPKRFIGEAITVWFDKPPLFEKRPGCPTGFTWQDAPYEVEEMLAEWHDYRRRGRMGQNMRPEHLQRAMIRGSWGVGRSYFRVRVAGGRVFELYYDRAPGSADEGKGSWFLSAEVR